MRDYPTSSGLLFTALYCSQNSDMLENIVEGRFLGKLSRCLQHGVFSGHFQLASFQRVFANDLNYTTCGEIVHALSGSVILRGFKAAFNSASLTTMSLSFFFSAPAFIFSRHNSRTVLPLLNASFAVAAAAS